MGLVARLCRRDTVIPLVLCTLWFSGSSLNSIFGKRFMKVIPMPVTVALGQLIMINIALPLYQGRGSRITGRDITSWVLPLAALKLLASLSSQLSLLKVPVSYTHTVKGLMPIFTVSLSRVILNQKHSSLAYCSLIPIVSGVVICSVSELSFNMIGLLSAIFSTMTFAVQNVYSKKVMNSGVNHISVLLAVSQASLVLLIPFWLYLEGYSLLVGPLLDDIGSEKKWRCMFDLFGTSAASTMQTVAAFTFLSRVTPVTYSVANVGKKVFVIVSSVLVFGNHISPTNAFGIAVCVFGIALYNKAKRNEKARAALEKHSKQAAGDLNYLRKLPELTQDNRKGVNGVGPALWPFTRRRGSSSDSVKIM